MSISGRRAAAAAGSPEHLYQRLRLREEPSARAGGQHLRHYGRILDPGNETTSPPSEASRPADRVCHAESLVMIDVRELTSRFPLAGRRTSSAVDAVSFTVKKGTSMDWLGANGAGKTTTLRMILGAAPSDVRWRRLDGFRSDEFPEMKSNAGWVWFPRLPRPVPVPVAAGNAVVLRRPLRRQGRCARRMSACESSGVDGIHRLALRNPQHGAEAARQPGAGPDPSPAGHAAGRADARARCAGDAGDHRVYRPFARGGEGSNTLRTHHLDEAERICTRFGLMHRGR